MVEVRRVEERRLIAPWQRLHDLGHWGDPSSTGKLGAVVDDGRVLGVTERPFTAEELHPVMRAQFGLGADFYRPSVYFVNSSVARFVEVSWLVSAAFVEFRILDLEEGPENGPPLDSGERRAEFLRACEAHGERRSWGLRALLARVEEIDPAVRGDDEEGAWYDAIVDLDPL
ncbi:MULTISPECIES: SUKH-4 family immunity protein [Actinosynnema]|uniref:SUKH-4 family immunity protein n=1 Tax=Actinosynnema TaxID=40566 RepID=UPI0020A4E8BF|nr:SUKH-4 family immunity protein [Actinosynnema pretiosum]MCP2096674.1 hypothetical protein [Actinosynnema pretiosum]